MPAFTTVRVDGLNRLSRTMRQAAGDIEDLKDASEKVGRIVVDAASPLTPVRSGRLRASARPARRANGARVLSGGARVPYAGPVHWGWPSRPDPDRGWRGGPIRGSEWLARTASQTEPVWLPIYTDAIQDALDTVRGA